MAKQNDGMVKALKAGILAASAIAGMASIALPANAQVQSYGGVVTYDGSGSATYSNNSGYGYNNNQPQYRPQVTYQQQNQYNSQMSVLASYRRAALAQCNATFLGQVNYNWASASAQKNACDARAEESYHQQRMTYGASYLGGYDMGEVNTARQAAYRRVDADYQAQLQYCQPQGGVQGAQGAFNYMACREQANATRIQSRAGVEQTYASYESYAISQPRGR